jgi:N-methylhydantoinase A/oxoprolinase/acetone carboxylase beta subunit
MMIIGLDVGGTHTDAVLLGSDGLVASVKVRTDASNLFQTVLSGLDEITAGIDPQRIQRIVLSTTLTTNAIAQRKIPPVGMIVSGGPGIDPEFFRTNPLYFPVSGAIDHRGLEITPVDEREVSRVADLLKQQEIRYVGVVGKFSVRNPQHEIRISNILNESFDRVFVGHKVSGKLNFARRIATTYLNTTMYPVHRAFFQAVKKSLDEKGLKVPIYVLKADGGTMNLTSSIQSPGQTALSGPAASTMGSLAFSPTGVDALSLDIGGTTTDMAVICDRTPLLHPTGIRVGGYRTLIRSIETRSIGIGGDSLVRIQNGALKIGPERQGPAMAHGGPVPTPTDALFVLGSVENGDRGKAAAGIQTVAEGLGVSIQAAAEQVLDHTCRKILANIRDLVERINNRPVYTVEGMQEGRRIKPTRILALGGPAPYFADHIEKISNINTRVIPQWQVANAVGAGLARTTCEVNLFADTQLGLCMAPQEGYKERIRPGFTSRDAVAQAYRLLEEKALAIGAGSDDLEMETVDNQQFNMVRGFQTIGKNIRVSVQVKPGLIHEYQRIVSGLDG